MTVWDLVTGVQTCALPISRRDRDIYCLSTTAEEKGLLGAHYFADHPVVPLSDITVALNVETIAISPRGTPVATIGRGKPAYDAVVREVATRDRKSTRLNSSH